MDRRGFVPRSGPRKLDNEERPKTISPLALTGAPDGLPCANAVTYSGVELPALPHQLRRVSGFALAGHDADTR